MQGWLHELSLMDSLRASITYAPILKENINFFSNQKVEIYKQNGFLHSET